MIQRIGMKRLIGSLEELKLATMVPPKKVESEDKPRYNSFGVFYYNDLNTVTKNIENTLDDMIDNINQVINLVK